MQISPNLFGNRCMALNCHQVRKPRWWQMRSQARADAQPPPGFWSSPGEAVQPLSFLSL